MALTRWPRPAAEMHGGGGSSSSSGSDGGGGGGTSSRGAGSVVAVPKAVCTHWLERGTCKFGDACVFDHGVPTLARRLPRLHPQHRVGPDSNASRKHFFCDVCGAKAKLRWRCVEGCDWDICLPCLAKADEDDAKVLASSTGGAGGGMTENTEVAPRAQPQVQPDSESQPEQQPEPEAVWTQQRLPRYGGSLAPCDDAAPCEVGARTGLRIATRLGPSTIAGAGTGACSCRIVAAYLAPTIARHHRKKWRPHPTP
jgi:hypothetical protein